MEQEENILGKEKIGKLIKKFSIPCIISMLVNSLYNIVDQIFIGQGVGTLGNGATNVVFPLVMIGLAFSLMFGDGASAYLSLKLGEKKKKEAEKGIGNGILLSAIVSIIFCVITLIFLPTNSPNVTYSSNIFFPLLARFTSRIINTACFSSITFL